MLHMNVRSIANTYDDLQAYLESLNYKFSVIGITETWLNKDNENKYPLLHYSFFGKTRKNKQGGGVGLYVNQAYQFKRRDDLAINVEEVIESQFIELTGKPSNMIVGIIYRLPNDKFNSFQENLVGLLQKLDSQNQTCFLMGDFNLINLTFLIKCFHPPSTINISTNKDNKRNCNTNR